MLNRRKLFGSIAGLLGVLGVGSSLSAIEREKKRDDKSHIALLFLGAAPRDPRFAFIQVRDTVTVDGVTIVKARCGIEQVSAILDMYKQQYDQGQDQFPDGTLLQYDIVGI